MNIAPASPLLLPRKQSINCNGKLLDLSIPRIMGIVNLTPDSFYVQSRKTQHSVLETARQMLAEGADILDLGAYSSRPGADDVSPAEEWARLEPALDALRTEFPEAILSVDSFRADIIRRAREQYHIDMANDIAAGQFDPDMFDTVVGLQIPYVMMHMQGQPRTMQQQPSYRDLMREIVAFFSERVAILKAKGLHDLVLDPGFGFGKTLEHNYQLLANLEEFQIFEQPLLVGLSRKSMIYRLLGNTPEQALNGTTVLHTLALQKGAHMLRVHDVAAARECIQLLGKTQACLTKSQF